MNYKKLIIKFIAGTLAVLMLFALLTAVIDPFFHYHKPLFGLKAVLTDKEYQCIGTIRNFDYDALIVGSSVCENYNNHWFDEQFGCTSIKAVRSYGATADLCFFMDEAYKNHDIKYVFYNLDPGSLSAEPELTFKSTGCPMYLYDRNPLNDFEYLLNKDVIFEKIPYMFAKSYVGEYDEGNSYNWGQYKEFNTDMILGLYVRKHSVASPNPADCYDKECDANLTMLEERIKAHPETEFYVFIPPYSCVWWDNIYRYGDTESYLHMFDTALNRLVGYDNVKLYYFMNDEEVVTNLSNYMDVLHFSPDINRYIVDELATEDRRVKEEDIDSIIDYSRDLSYRTVNEILVPYENIIKIEPYDY